MFIFNSNCARFCISFWLLLYNFAIVLVILMCCCLVLRCVCFSVGRCYDWLLDYMLVE